MNEYQIEFFTSYLSEFKCLVYKHVLRFFVAVIRPWKDFFFRGKLSSCKIKACAVWKSTSWAKSYATDQSCLQWQCLSKSNYLPQNSSRLCFPTPSIFSCLAMYLRVLLVKSRPHGLLHVACSTWLVNTQRWLANWLMRRFSEAISDYPQIVCCWEFMRMAKYIRVHVRTPLVMQVDLFAFYFLQFCTFCWHKFC